MKRFVFLFSLSFLLLSCLPDEPTFEDFRRTELRRLLSNGESKRWLLQERLLFSEEVAFDSCTNPRQLIFNFTAATGDKDSLFYVNPSDTCSNTTDTLKGFWFVPPTAKAQVSIDTVVFVWQLTDTAYFQVNNISPENFNISTYFEEDSLNESFSHFPLPADEEEDN